MYKGKMLKDDAGLSAVPEGATVMLLGSAEALPLTPPSRKVLFTEDITNEQKQQLQIPGENVGLRNVGNTCYLNSVVQALRHIPELKAAVDTNDAQKRAAGAKADMSRHFSQLCRTMGTSTEAVVPVGLLTSLRTLAPQFAEAGPGGVMAQQDADECMMVLLSALGKEMSVAPAAGDAGKAVAAKLPKGTRDFDNCIDALFGMHALTETKLVDAGRDGKEDTTVRPEHLSKLRCLIDGQVNHLTEGLRAGLTERVTKRSEPLGRDAEYERTTRVSSLPPYALVQLSRFMWRQDTKHKAKILRRVSVPMQLDLFEFTGGELRERLAAAREKAVQDKAKAIEAKEAKGAAETAMTDADTEGDVTAGPKESCEYELTGVVAHRGRDADSGHYVAYVKQGKQWLKCDDASVEPVDEDAVLALAGGGDWQMAYLCVYKQLPAQ